MTMKFETEVCSRCGGSGHFSYNQMTGTTCFKCQGVGKTYTKRGRAAFEYSRTIRETAIVDVEVGTRVYWGNGGRCTVSAISEPFPTGGKSRSGDATEWTIHMNVTVSGQGDFKTNMYPNQIVRKGWTQEMIDDVTAYQAGLTKAGKPRKRPAKQVAV